MGYIREITIDAPVDAVWRAFASPGELQRWLAPHAEVELRVGGAFELSWGDAGDTKGCHIVALEPGRCVCCQQPTELQEVPLNKQDRKVLTTH